MIELGRYRQISRENRLCPTCKSNDIEGEIHFLLKCPMYSTLREQFLITSAKYFDALSLVVTRGQLMVTRGHSCVLLDTIIVNNFGG